MHAGAPFTLTASSSGLRLCPNQIPQVAVDVFEALGVHAAVVLGRVRRPASRCDRLGDEAVELFLALAGQAENDLVALLRLEQRFVDEGLEEGLGHQHRMDAVFHDDEHGRILAAVLGVEAESERGKESLGLFQVLDCQVNDDLPVHGVLVWDGGWDTGASPPRRTGLHGFDIGRLSC